ncbi:L-threonylcarbamoyladenylate synthase [Croceivirga thetidis]|uniref:L-threonylcarbamoyladenylate synthase n=1 Tax=Croceivirga thetidis TaxID=2721623 RepID=A0ABX1GSI9_9FLAO|nr:Sua5/YciO/YrdC/YwlC family protein [Croceivirga thetidis]NKI32917.1 Sua5/YciO/YrdC/YwlC family protein [Croceivirga thetidis]
MTEEINKCHEVLKNGGLICYPTDTVWGIGCDASNASAIEKLFGLKKRNEPHEFTCLVANQSMLERHVEEVPKLAYDIIDLASKPTTILYDEPNGVAKNLILEDQTLAIRVVTDKFCQYLINKFKKPIVFTAANFNGQRIPKSFNDISKDILNGVEYVVNLPLENRKSQRSTIIKLSVDGKVKVIKT